MLKARENLMQDEPLAKYTAARLGGKADWLYIARDSVEELAEVVSEAWAQGMPVRVLGGGANVLVSDSGVRGLVVINRVSDIQFGEWYGERTVSAASGTSLTLFSNKCQAHGLAGMEWAVNVPGTVGGAVVNNAGAHGSDMAEAVREIVVIEPSGPKLYKRIDMAYDYRFSAFKVREDKRFLVLLATFKLPHDDPKAIRQRMDAFITYRKNTQPPGASLGSVFKNPPGDYAGRLVEQVGLKGYKLGNAMVSPKHGNFILSGWDRSLPVCAADYYHLIQHVQATVQAETGVHLELEIELLGEWP
ncbi:MAG: UDP-N-acetylmuramate dehydrogenase [Anaerolineae bacterium]